MSEKFVRNRILGTIDINTDEAKEHTDKKIKIAASGAIPYVVREMMKEHGWQILSTSTDEQEKEKAKLLICYAWWARALENDIPKKYFEEFMLDNLKYLDEDRKDSKSREKWQKYG